MSKRLLGWETGGREDHVARAAWSRLLEAAGVVLLLPLMIVPLAVIALAVVLDSPGPALFRATRIGRGGKPFRMLKFRTMRLGPPGPSITAGDDPRITPLGRFLRGTRLDELPQLWNVVRGEMRLVGPRPEDPAFVADHLREYRQILGVAPGITGRAQLEFGVTEARALLGHADPSDHYRREVLPAKIALDLDYVRTRTVAGDLRILAATLALPFGLAAGRISALLRDRWTPGFGYAAATGAVLVLAFLAAGGAPR